MEKLDMSGIVAASFQGRYEQIKAEEIRQSLAFKDEMEHQDELDVLVDTFRLVLTGWMNHDPGREPVREWFEAGWEKIRKGVHTALLAEHGAVRHYDVWDMPEGSEWWV